MRLLLAEDEVLSPGSDGAAAEEQLSGFGVRRGEALAYLSSGNYDEAILDMMPKVDGIQVLRQLRGREPAAGPSPRTARRRWTTRCWAWTAEPTTTSHQAFRQPELLADPGHDRTNGQTPQLRGNVTLDRATFGLSTPSEPSAGQQKGVSDAGTAHATPEPDLTETVPGKIWDMTARRRSNVGVGVHLYLRKKLAALHSNVPDQGPAERRRYSLEEFHDPDPPHPAGGGGHALPAGGAHGDSGVILLGSYRGLSLTRTVFWTCWPRGGPFLPCRRISAGRRGPAAAPRLGYEIRYLVLLDESGNMATCDLGQIAAVDQGDGRGLCPAGAGQEAYPGVSPGLPVTTAQERARPGCFPGLQRLPVHLPIHRCLQGFGCRQWGCWQCFSCCSSSRRIIRPILKTMKTRSGSSPTPVTS